MIVYRMTNTENDISRDNVLKEQFEKEDAEFTKRVQKHIKKRK